MLRGLCQPAGSRSATEAADAGVLERLTVLASPATPPSPAAPVVPVWGMVISADAVRERPLIRGTAPRRQRCDTYSAMTAASHPAGEAATTPYLGHGFALTPVGMIWRPHEPTRRLAPTCALEHEPEASMGLRRQDRWPSP